jgi:hypothetical protein
MTLALVPPVFGNFLGGFVQPASIPCQPDTLFRLYKNSFFAA